MLKKMAKAAVLLGALSGAATAATYWYCPGIWVQIDRKVTEFAGWTEEARRADPAGFVDHATRGLREDLDVMRRTSRELVAEIAQVSKNVREQEALRDQANGLANEYRELYQTACTNGNAPIVIRNAAYTTEDVKVQVRMILAEAAGYEEALDALKTVQEQAESELEKLTVRINSTETKLVALAAQREILLARALSDEGEQLLAQIADLMDGNKQVIVQNPVRNVRELLAVSMDASRPEDSNGMSDVEAFLAASPNEGQVEQQDVSAGESVAELDGSQEATAVTPSVDQQPTDNSQDEETATAEQEKVEKPTRKVKKSRPKRKAGAVAAKKQQADDTPPKLIFQQF